MTSPWFPFGTADDAGLRLICLPHAGAGASGYRTWGRGLPADLGACPVQLPGRESRLGEQPHDRIGPLVAALADVVIEQLRPPYAVFGHSLGAAVGYELTRRLLELGAPAPLHLFVSGRHAPQQPNRHAILHDLGPADLVAELTKLGGTPAAVLADPDLLAMITPLLKADFAVNETYRFAGFEAAPPLDVPITAFAAAADPRVRPAEMSGWSEHTTAGFRLHPLPGGHFAVLQQAAFVHGRIAEGLRTPTPH